MTIASLINILNDRLQVLFQGYAGAKFYGVAESIYRQIGVEQETLPGVVGADGEIVYVGPDDTAPIIGYWKVQTISTNTSANRSYGRTENNMWLNLYRVSLILYADSKRIQLLPDELYLIVFANLNGRIVPEQSDFRHVSARLNGVNFDSRGIYLREYTGTQFKLPANRRMIEISCTIEGEFEQSCLDKLCCK